MKLQERKNNQDEDLKKDDPLFINMPNLFGE